MLSLNNNILVFTLLMVITHVHCLEALRSIDDNATAMTEMTIRNTFNNLFTSLRIKDIRQNTKLKQFVTIHNYFVSVTLKDCDNLKEIVRLTRVNNIDNNTQNFISQINDILNEGHKTSDETDDIHVHEYIEAFILKLRQLKEVYGYNRYSNNPTVNADVLNILNKDENCLGNFTNPDTANNIDNNLNSDEVWQPSGRRVFHGHKTRIRFFPFMAAIHIFGTFQCAGSIVRKDMVLTAASCVQLAWNNRFFRENPVLLSVQIGCDFYMNGGEVIQVQELFFHPDYEPKNLRNNLVILRLGVHIVFSKKAVLVKRIQMDSNPHPLPSNTNGITILGWGATHQNNMMEDPWSERLTYAELEFYPIEDCQAVYSKEYVSEKNFCAGFFTKGGGACNHDVGGPAVIAGILVGVISFGPPICGTVDAPTVFTKVGFYREWINNIMRQPLPEIVRLSTKLIHKTSFATHYSDKTRATFTFHPITKEPLSKSSPPQANLRILQDDKLFKKFMETMFKNHEAIDEPQLKWKKKVTSKNMHRVKSKQTNNQPSAEETTESGESTQSKKISEKKHNYKPKSIITSVKYSDNHIKPNANKDDVSEIKLQNDIEILLNELDLYKLMDSQENPIEVNSDSVSLTIEDDKSSGPDPRKNNDFEEVLVEKPKKGKTKEIQGSKLKGKRTKQDTHLPDFRTKLDYELSEKFSTETESADFDADIDKQLEEEIANEDNESLETELEQNNNIRHDNKQKKDDTDSSETNIDEMDASQTDETKIIRGNELDDIKLNSAYNSQPKYHNKKENVMNTFDEITSVEDNKPNKIESKKIKKHKSRNKYKGKSFEKSTEDSESDDSKSKKDKKPPSFKIQYKKSKKAGGTLRNLKAKKVSSKKGKKELKSKIIKKEVRNAKKKKLVTTPNKENEDVSESSKSTSESESDEVELSIAID